MAMSDCEKCWNTPCDCGWKYREDTKIRRIKLASAVLGVHPELLKLKFGKDIPDVHPSQPYPIYKPYEQKEQP